MRNQLIKGFLYGGLVGVGILALSLLMGVAGFLIWGDDYPPLNGPFQFYNELPNYFFMIGFISPVLGLVIGFLVSCRKSN